MQPVISVYSVVSSILLASIASWPGMAPVYMQQDEAGVTYTFPSPLVYSYGENQEGEKWQIHILTPITIDT